MAKNAANVEAQSMVLQLGDIQAWLVVADDDSAFHIITLIFVYLP